MTMKKKICLLGSTGSIGTQTLQVIDEHPDLFEAYVLTANSRADLLIEQARKYQPAAVVIADESKYEQVRLALDKEPIQVYTGSESLCQVVQMGPVDIVLTALVGFSGLRPTISAIKAHKTIALANKETLVVAGELVTGLCLEEKVAVLPVDSEHNAIFQCLAGATEKARAGARIVLTASGGPFRGRTNLEGITPEQAVAHPKWSMGRKISVDSASLMNKGLEVIEARWLFDFEPGRIKVVVHPESIVHSAVEFEDGAVIAQLGSADMRTPIAYSLGWPERLDGCAKRLSLAEIGRLTFEEPDTKTFPLLQAAYDALAADNGATIVLNAANEIAVEAFLEGRIGFTDIFSTVRGMLESILAPLPGSVDEIIELDRAVRAKTRERLAVR